MKEVQAMTVTVLGDGGYPLHTARVTREEGRFDEIGEIDKFLAAGRKSNPHLGWDGIVKAILRQGVRVVAKQIRDGKLDTFLTQRTS